MDSSETAPDLRRCVKTLPTSERIKQELVRNAQEKRLLRQLLKIAEQQEKIEGGSR